MNNKKLRKGLKKLGAKCIHAFGVFLMVLQTFAMPLSYGVLLSPSRAIAADEDPAVNEAPATPAETDSTSSPQAIPADKTEEVAIEPATTETATTPDPAVETTTPAETIDTPAIIEEVTGTIDPEAASIVAPDETPTVTPEIVQPTENITPTATESADNVAPVVNDKVCLDDNAEIKASEDSDWNVDGQNKAETKEKVKLGVKYEFPLNKEVSVTFTCLPTDENKLSTLKIEQIASDKIDLPDGLSSALPYAYDITTGMDNGDFKYNLTLPKSEVSNAEVSYVEKSAEEITGSAVRKDDLKNIDEDKIKTETDSVKVSDLDHFTIYILTYSGPTFEISKNTFIRGDKVFFLAGELIPAKFYKIELVEPGTSTPKVIVNYTSGNTTINGSYGEFDGSDTFGTWNAILYEANNNSGSGKHEVSRTTFELIASNIVWPSNWNTPSSCVSDPSGDESPSEIDIVGDSSNPAVGFNSDNNYQYFRERLNGNPGSFVQKAWVVLFQTSVPQYQYLGSLNGKNDKVQLWKNTSATGPVDFSPILNDPAEDIVWEGSASVYARTVNAGGGKYYVDWAIPKSELTSRGINTDTIKFFATSADANNFNKDHLECYEAIADLSIVKSDSPDPVYSGSTLTYTLNIHNAGPDAASGVIVTDTLPAGYSVMSVTPSQGSCSDIIAPDLQCELGNMANGANATITIVGTIVGLGTVTNTTSVSLDATVSIDTNPNNNTDSEDTTINPSAGNLIVHKTFTDSHSNSGITINLSPGGTTQVTDSSGNATFSNLSAGTYSATATEPAGYYESATTCINVSVTAGQTANCTITDSPILGTITVHKTIVGGTATPSQFCFTLNPNPGNGEICADNGTGNAVFNNIPAGSYSASETTKASDYTQTGNTCSGLVIVNNGDSRSCTVTNTRDTGQLKAIKTIDDGTALTQWSFKLNDGGWITANASGEVDFGQVLTLTDHTIYEKGPDGYHLGSVSCTNTYTDNHDGSATTVVSKNGTTTCTFNNNVDKGTITIVKEASPKDAQDFSFTTTGRDLSGFSLDDDADNTLSNTKTFPSLYPGDFSVTEDSASGWDLTNISCVESGGQSAQNSTTDKNTRKVTLKLEAGENITCTFTNTLRQTDVTVEKSDDPDPVNNHGTLTYTLTASNLSNDIAAENVIVTDSLPGGVAPTSVIPSQGSCSDTTIVDDLDIVCELGTLAPLASATVTIIGTVNLPVGVPAFYNDVIVTTDTPETNTGNNSDTEETTINHTGTLHLVKNTVGGNDSFGFTVTGLTPICMPGAPAICWDAPIPPTSHTITTISGTSSLDISLKEGQYSLAETTIPTGWNADGGVCDQGETPASLDVDPGETVTCTFTNSKLPTLTVNKTLSPSDDPGKFNLQIDGSTAGTGANVGNTGTTGAVTVSIGSHTVGETAGTGTSLSDYTTVIGTPCAADGKITLAAGENKICTITNTRKTGTLRVIKNVVDASETPLDPSNWSINVKQNGTDVTGSPQAGSGAGTVYTLPTGAYQVVEPIINVLNKDFHLTFSGDCARVVSGPGYWTTADVTVVAGQESTCTLTNERHTDTIAVHKEVDTNGDGTFEGDNTVANDLGFRWGFNDGPVDREMGTSLVYGLITNPTGDWGIHENTVSGYHYVGYYLLEPLLGSCNNPYQTTYPSPDPAGSPQPRTYVLCNARDTGTITIDKATNPSGDSQEFTFHVVQIDNTSWNGATQHFNPLPGGFSQIVNIADLTTPPVITVPTGDYDLYEDVPGGWTQGGYTCSYTAGARSGGGIMNYNFDIRTGENATCTFTNTQRGSITGYKWEDVNANGVWDSGEPALSGWEIFIDANKNYQYDSGEPKTATDANGYYEFSVAPGEYWIFEIQKDGWSQQVPYYTLGHSYFIINVAAGQAYSDNNFGNYRYAHIEGDKWNDLNGDGVWDKSNEPSLYLPGLRYRIYKEVSPGVYSEVINGPFESSHYGEYVWVAPGTYWVAEYNGPSGWIQTHPDNNAPTVFGMRLLGPITVLSGGSSSNNDLGNFQLGSISGQKFNDLNGNGVKDTGEPGLQGWTIYIDSNANDALDPGETSVLTDASGNYSFTGLMAGAYQVREQGQTGWLQTTINPTDITIQSGTNTTGVDFGNVQLTDIHGYKWNDLDGNGSQNGEEPKLSGWEIFIDKDGDSVWDNGEPKITTSSDPDPAHFGWYWFENLLPGQYKICEIQQTGWTQTYPTPPCHTITLPDANPNAFAVTANMISAPEYNFGNQFVIPELKIKKNNDATGDKHPGDSVTYTLTIKAAGGEEGEILNQSNVNNVEVTDLPPAGFVYRSGSWTADSTVRGDIKNSPTTEPTYHSPGVWKLGDMVPGEIVTLTYIADISSGQDSGLYRDLAWTEGIDLLGNQVLGTYGDPEYFVGTQVAVVRPVSASVEIPETTETHTTTKHKTKEVLGAAIILPATGANAIWVIIAAALLLAGLALTILGRRKNKPNNFSAQTPMKVLITLIFSSALILGFANASQAGVIDDLIVKIEQPKSPSNNDFLIGFVALDIQGKDMTVDCYKKGPSDAAFSIFDTVNLIAGGTSGDCVVDPAVAPVDGNYDFFARATASDSRLANSDTVSVDIVIQGPGTPVNYNKDKLSSCENKISFTTANDSGRTVRAEIYRSTSTAFVADDSTRVANITGLTSNQDVSYTDTVPDCSLKYYYVARAFDAADNGSGFVGDEEVNVEHRTRTKTTTRTIHPTVTTAGAIPVTGGGAVGGAEIGGEAQPGAGEEGQVLGEEMETQGQAVASWFAKNKWPLIIIIIVILLAIYGYRRRNKSEKSV